MAKYYAGIDVSKSFHICYVIDENENIDNNYNSLANLNSIIEDLKSIPGLPDKTIITVLAERGDLTRFKNSKKFISYIGLFHEIYQSGKYQIKL